MAYFPTKDGPLKDKWVRLRGVAETIGLSAKARKKLEWIIFYNTVSGSNAKVTASYSGISRKTLHKWLSRLRVYTSSSSASAKDFLQRPVYLSNGQISNIHHDNGSEFEKEFEKACRELGINQIYSRVRTPKDNPALERFNWTIQDEWLSVSESGLDDINEANLDLTNWLITYNNIRPHKTLDYLTPIEYATQRYKVSLMWASRTPS